MRRVREKRHGWNWTSCAETHKQEKYHRHGVSPWVARKSSPIPGTPPPWGSVLGSPISGFENQWSLTPGNQRFIENSDSAFHGPAQRPQFQEPWVISDRYLWTNLKCAGETGNCRSFLQAWKHCWAPFSCSPSGYLAQWWWELILALSIYLGSAACPPQCFCTNLPNKQTHFCKVNIILPHPVGSNSQDQHPPIVMTTPPHPVESPGQTQCHHKAHSISGRGLQFCQSVYLPRVAAKALS